MSHDTLFLGGILITHRRPEAVAATLRVVSEQARPPDLVVVVNNEADERTAEAVRGAAAGIAVDYLPVTDNLGPAGAFGAGLARLAELRADYDAVVQIEDDDPPPDRLVYEDLLRFVSEHRHREGFAGVGLDGARLSRFTGFLRPLADDRTAVVAVDYLKGGFCPVFMREALETTHGYDPRLFFGFEELELGLRLRRAGMTLWAMPARPTDLRQTAGSTQALLQPWSWRRYYSARNLIWVLRRDHRHLAAVVVTCRLLLKGLVNLVLRPRVTVRHVFPTLRAIRDGWADRMGLVVPPAPDPDPDPDADPVHAPHEEPLGSP